MRFTHSLMGLGLAVISLPTLAQVAPDAGQSLQSIDQAPLQLPSTESIELNLPDTPSTDMSVSGPNLQVNGFSLSGNLAIDSAELLSLLDDLRDRKSTRLNSSHVRISYAVFCLKKKTI